MSTATASTVPVSTATASTVPTVLVSTATVVADDRGLTHCCSTAARHIQPADTRLALAHCEQHLDPKVSLAHDSGTCILTASPSLKTLTLHLRAIFGSAPSPLLWRGRHRGLRMRESLIQFSRVYPPHTSRPPSALRRCTVRRVHMDICRHPRYSSPSAILQHASPGTHSRCHCPCHPMQRC